MQKNATGIATTFGADASVVTDGPGRSTLWRLEWSEPETAIAISAVVGFRRLRGQDQRGYEQPKM